jgi:hypothetical protein
MNKQVMLLDIYMHQVNVEKLLIYILNNSIIFYSQRLRIKQQVKEFVFLNIFNAYA